jgi:hypothetical protein
VALKGGARFAVDFAQVFPGGCKFLPDSVSVVEDYDEKNGRRTPARDKVSGTRVYQVRVYDMDPELSGRAREVTVKISVDVQPVPPVGPFEEIEFVGLTVTPWVSNNGRLAYSLRAAGMRASVAGVGGKPPRPAPQGG